MAEIPAVTVPVTADLSPLAEVARRVGRQLVALADELAEAAAPQVLFYADSPSYPAVCTELLNPVTRSIVRIRPAFKVTSEAAWDEMAERFSAYCQAAWEFGRLDPKEVRLFSAGEDAAFALDLDTPSTLWPAAAAQ